MKNKPFFKKNRTFTEKISTSNAIMALIILSCVGLFNVINSISVDNYNETTVALNKMSSFYEDVNRSTSFVKDYLYTENRKSLTAYKKFIINANEDIEVLKKNSTSENYFRFVMLERMLENYDLLAENLVEHFNENKSDYNGVYSDFLMAGTLISRTSGDYYNLINKEVNIQLKNLKKIENSTQVGSILLLVVLLLWMLYYSNQLTRSITKPINLLLKNISRIKKGKYDLSHVSNASKEMEDLCDAMNDMAFAIQRNFEDTEEKAKLEKQVLEWKNQNLKKDELLAQSELKMLQNQINPHFLFNTLNMIYKLAINEGAKDAAEILIKTSHLLRYGLDNQNKSSDLKSEVEMLKNYIAIQEIRLGKRVCFEVTFNDSQCIGSLSMPSMVLQPLVENAIKHGLKDCLKNGKIEIHLNGDDTYTRISISDNGVGMSSDELEEFILNDYQKTSGNHLGLYNVVRRLQMYYQDKVNVIINSDLDCGFEIIIEIQT